MKAPDQPLTCILKAYEQVPDLYLILSPDLVILTASDAYLKATYTKREEIAGRKVFDVFPVNPVAMAATGIKNLRKSLQQVLATKQPHRMAIQQYDVPLPADLGGGFAEKHWLLLNTPVLDEQGRVQYIIHKTEEVTAQVKAAQEKNQSRELVIDQGEELFLLHRDVIERKQRALHQDFLLRFSDRLRTEFNADAMATSALQMLNEELQLDRSYITTYHLEENRADLDYQVGNDTVPPLPDHFMLSDYPKTFKAIFEGTVVIEDELSRQELTEAEKHNSGKLGMRAMVVATLRKENQPEWSMVAMSSRPRNWTQSEITLIDEVAERTWAAIKRAKAEEALASSEEKYRTLFASMDEGYCIIQMIYDDAGKAIDFKYLQVNQAFERNNGLHNAEGKTIRELAPAIESKWIEIYDQVAQTGTPLRFEESSEALHRAFTLYAFRIGEPDEHKVAVIFSDITERKKAQEALQRSEEQFRLFVTASSDIIYKMNADWSHLQMLTGDDFLPDTQVSGNSWIDVFIPKEDREGVKSEIQEAILTQSIFRLEHKVNKADGSVGWLSSRAIPVLDKHGKLAEWFGTASDITLRKETEQQLHDLNETLEQQVADRTSELQESKLFAEQITEATPDFVMIFNLLQNKVEFVNQGPYSENQDRYHETLRIEYEELMSRAHPDDRQKLHCFVDGFRTTSEQTAQTLEYRVINQGKITWYRSRGKVFRRNEAGTPTHFISVVQDISDLKQLEQENLQIRLDQQRNLLLAILEAQEEERRRISESLHNGVAHLLYATKLQVESLVQKVPNEHALKLNNLLKDAINETRRVSHELVPVILKDFGLKQALCEMCERLSSRDLRIACEVETFEQKLDNYIELVLYRTCQELVNNIFKHAKASEAKVLLYQEENTMHLKVRDNGVGIKKQPAGRNGIGLRSIKDRIKLLNGTFEITKPATGNGTQVEIVIPLH